MANVPFLMILTDGGFSPPDNFGPLYKNNLGNIMYIVWKKLNIENCRPQNFIYSDMNVEGFEDVISTRKKKP